MIIYLSIYAELTIYINAGAVSVPIEVDPTSDDNDIIEVDSSKFSAGTYLLQIGSITELDSKGSSI